MQELLYDLEVLVLIRKALSQSYNVISDSSKLIGCISFIDEMMLKKRLWIKILPNIQSKMGSLYPLKRKLF